ncbi:hypothetical protein FH972_025813 [Carpinus fangiana]|uniref:Vacuolar protein sorting-associated protein 8 central domain-containing protein n=1 Tax=Carpinus fangiana TaxID=176857 RepID=A0A5N6L239_9ROSI|nr:hypothetical protein FH972_025813 [Carpinus fangiana]
MTEPLDADEHNGQELDTDEDKSEDNAGVTDLQDEIRRSGSRAGRGGSLGPQDFDKDGHSIPPTPAEGEVVDSFVAAGVLAEELTLPAEADAHNADFPDMSPSPAQSSSARDDQASVTGSIRSNLSPGPRNPFERRFVARSPSGRPQSLRNVSGVGFLNAHSRQPSSSSQATLDSEDLEDEAKEKPWELIKWTKLKKITSQAYSESAKRAFGQPTALVVSASIVLGTSKGLILVFDYQQVLKQVIGQGTSAIECGSITALAMSADHTTIAGGHANGSINTWDLSQPSRQFLTIPPQPSVNRSGDGHLADRAVLHLGFLGTRRTALISADDCGMAFSHLATRGLGAVGRTVKTTRVLGRYPDPKIASRKPSSVLACSSLPLGNVEHPTDDFGLTAILTPYLLVVVSTTPIAQTQFKSPRSKDVAAHSAMTGCLSWFPSVRMKATASNAKRTVTPTKLVFCWGNVVSVLEIHPIEADEPSKRATLEFKVRTRWSCEEPILAVQWLSRSVLALLTITQRLLIIEDQTMHVAGASDLNPRHIYHRDLFSRQLLPLVDKAEQEDSTLHGVVPDAYHMSVKAYKGRMFVLGMNDASMGIMSNWADRLAALMEAGRHIDAVELATAYYAGGAEKQTVGLPEDDASRQAIVKGRLLDILTASLRYILKAVDDDELDMDVRTAFQDFVAPAFAACLTMGEVDFLLHDLYEWYSDQSCQDIFLYALEPCILDQRITSIPPEVLKDLMTWFASFGLNDRLEELIIELDTSTMDIDQITSICKAYRLYDAMIHVWNTALEDYLTPLIELLSLAMQPQSKKDAQEYILDQESAAKIFPYMAYVLTGRSYPDGTYLSSQDANRARSWVYGFLFSTKLVRWPLQHGRAVDFDSQAASDKLYPYIRCLISFDCSSLMSMLNEAFEDPFLNGDEEQYANGAASLDLRDFTSGAKFNRQRIVNILIEVFNEANFSEEDKTFFNMFLARNVSKYRQGFLLLPESVLRKVIRELCSYPLDELANECQLSVEYLLSVYHPPDIQQLVPIFQKAGFYRILKSTFRSERQYAKCLEAYFADKDDQDGVFDCIHDLLRPGRLNARQRRDVVVVIQEHAQQMIDIDTYKAAKTLLSSAPDLLGDVAGTLSSESYGKFQFLGSLLEPKDGQDSLARVPGDFVVAYTEQYVQLMCRHRPQHVADYIGSLKSGDLRLDAVLPTMEESGVIDAAVVLLARDGLAERAIDRLIVHLNTLKTAITSLVSSTSPDTISSEEALTDLIDAVHKREAGRGGVVCMRASVSQDVPGEEHWRPGRQRQRRRIYLSNEEAGGGDGGAEGGFDDAPEQVAHGRGAVEGAVEVPAAEVELRGDGVELGGGERFGGGFGGVSGAGAVDGGVEQDVADGGHVLEDHLHAQGADDLNGGVQVGVFGERDHVGLVAAGVGHQPEAHLGDDAQVGVRLDGWVRQRTHSCADEFAGGQDDLHAAVHHEVVAVRCVANASLNSVADHAPATEVRGVDPDMLAQVIILESGGPAELECTAHTSARLPVRRVQVELLCMPQRLAGTPHVPMQHPARCGAFHP